MYTKQKVSNGQGEKPSQRNDGGGECDSVVEVQYTSSTDGDRWDLGVKGEGRAEIQTFARQTPRYGPVTIPSGGWRQLHVFWLRKPRE